MMRSELSLRAETRIRRVQSSNTNRRLVDALETLACWKIRLVLLRQARTDKTLLLPGPRTAFLVQRRGTLLTA